MSARPAPVVDIAPLLTASRTINAVIVRSLAQVDERLTVPQLRVLVILDRRDGASLAAVAEDLGVNPSNASRTCDQLVRRDLVSRVPDELDRRRVVLTLSAHGRALLDQAMQHRRELLATAVASMSPDDQRLLVRAMEAFNAATVTLGDIALEGTAPTATSVTTTL